MASVTKTQADQLSHCATQPSLISATAITTDQFYSRLQVRSVEGNCWSYPMAELPVANYSFIAGTDPILSTPATYPTAQNRDDALAYMGAMVEVSGDIATNLSSVNPVLMDQTLLVVRGMQLAIEAQFYDPLSVAAPDPTNLPALVDRAPLPWVAPRDASGYLQIPDMGCMIGSLSPLDPSAADYFVMPQALLYEIYDLYRADGMAPPMKEDPLNPGVLLPTVYDIPMLISNHIPLEVDGTMRMYLARLANGTDAPNKSEPLVRLAPAEVLEGATGDPADFQVTQQRPDSGLADLVQVNIWKSVAYSSGSDMVQGMRGINLRTA